MASGLLTLSAGVSYFVFADIVQMYFVPNSNICLISETWSIADMISMACLENDNQPDCRTAVETPYEFLEALANRIDRCLQNQK